MQNGRKIGFMSDSPEEKENKPSGADGLAMLWITHMINNYSQVSTLHECDFISNDTLIQETSELTGTATNKFDFITAMEKEGYHYKQVEGKGIVWLIRRLNIH